MTRSSVERLHLASLLFLGWGLFFGVRLIPGWSGCDYGYIKCLIVLPLQVGAPRRGDKIAL
jgi:hypothetical protein